jgi:hypothetical protein
MKVFGPDALWNFRGKLWYRAHGTELQTRRSTTQALSNPCTCKRSL